jgi:hypothetical protein
LGPLDTTATNKPIVLAPGDYDDDDDDGKIGGMIDRGNRSAWREHAPLPLCPQLTPHTARTRISGRRGGKPAINRLSYFFFFNFFRYLEQYKT